MVPVESLNLSLSLLSLSQSTVKSWVADARSVRCHCAEPFTEAIGGQAAGLPEEVESFRCPR
jgi:hypothetical protein